MTDMPSQRSRRNRRHHSQWVSCLSALFPGNHHPCHGSLRRAATGRAAGRRHRTAGCLPEDPATGRDGSCRDPGSAVRRSPPVGSRQTAITPELDRVQTLTWPKHFSIPWSAASATLSAPIPTWNFCATPAPLPSPRAGRDYQTFPAGNRTLETLCRAILNTSVFQPHFRDIERDARRMAAAARRGPTRCTRSPSIHHVDLIVPPFFRGMGAYLIGRTVTPTAPVIPWRSR